MIELNYEEMVAVFEFIVVSKPLIQQNQSMLNASIKKIRQKMLGECFTQDLFMDLKRECKVTMHISI